MSNDRKNAAGVKTSEFYMYGASVAVGAVLSMLPPEKPDEPTILEIIRTVGGIVMSIFGALGYGFNRSSVKKAAQLNDARK